MKVGFILISLLHSLAFASKVPSKFVQNAEPSHTTGHLLDSLTEINDTSINIMYAKVFNYDITSVICHPRNDYLKKKYFLNMLADINGISLNSLNAVSAFLAANMKDCFEMVTRALENVVGLLNSFNSYSHVLVTQNSSKLNEFVQALNVAMQQLVSTRNPSNICLVYKELYNMQNSIPIVAQVDEILANWILIYINLGHKLLDVAYTLRTQYNQEIIPLKFERTGLDKFEIHYFYSIASYISDDPQKTYLVDLEDLIGRFSEFINQYLLMKRGELVDDYFYAEFVLQDGLFSLYHPSTYAHCQCLLFEREKAIMEFVAEEEKETQKLIIKKVQQRRLALEDKISIETSDSSSDNEPEAADCISQATQVIEPEAFEIHDHDRQVGMLIVAEFLKKRFLLPLKIALGLNDCTWEVLLDNLQSIHDPLQGQILQVARCSSVEFVKMVVAFVRDRNEIAHPTIFQSKSPLQDLMTISGKLSPTVYNQLKGLLANIPNTYSANTQSPLDPQNRPWGIMTVEATEITLALIRLYEYLHQKVTVIIANIVQVSPENLETIHVASNFRILPFKTSDYLAVEKSLRSVRYLYAHPKHNYKLVKNYALKVLLADSKNPVHSDLLKTVFLNKK